MTDNQAIQTTLSYPESLEQTHQQLPIQRSRLHQAQYTVKSKSQHKYLTPKQVSPSRLDFSTDSKIQIQDLRPHILQLAQSLDEIIAREVENKKPIEKPQMDSVIKEQMQEIEKLKNKIKANNRRIQMSVEDARLTELQEQLSQLQHKETSLKLEYNSIKKIQIQQSQALAVLNSKDNLQKKEQYQQAIKLEKGKTKQLSEQIRLLESQLKQRHEVHFKQQEKLKQIDNRLSEYKKKNNKKITGISEDDISILENQLNELSQEMETNNNLYSLNLKSLNKERQMAIHEIDLKEKEFLNVEKVFLIQLKEFKLAQIRYNEKNRIQKKHTVNQLKLSQIKQEDLHRPHNTPHE